MINTLRPRQNGRHFTDDTFKSIFLNENVIISIKISLKFVRKGTNKNIPALVQIMAWRPSCSENIQHNLMIVSSTYPWPSSSTVDLNLNGNITHEDSQFLSECIIWLMHETLLWNTRFEAITELATSPRVLHYQKPNEIALLSKLHGWR